MKGFPWLTAILAVLGVWLLVESGILVWVFFALCFGAALSIRREIRSTTPKSRRNR